MGIHSPNAALIQSQVLDPGRPEVVVFAQAWRRIPPGGVEYLQPVLVRNLATGVVTPWCGDEHWPSSYVQLTPDPQLFGQTFQGPMPGHVPGMPWHWDLHVWVWANNPSGM